MRSIQRVGPYLEIVEARSPENHNSVFKLGLLQTSFSRLVNTGQLAKCAQFYGLIQPGLLDAVHAFEGLKRPLMRADDMHGDDNFIAYSWRPENDYFWGRSRFDGEPSKRRPIPGEVFVVLVHLYKEPECYLENIKVEGSIEHWSWVRADSESPLKPIEWNERYRQPLWSREV